MSTTDDLTAELAKRAVAHEAARRVSSRIGCIRKEWEPYEGPRGGQGWRHTGTGEVRYQEEKPTDDPSEEDDTADAASLEDDPAPANEPGFEPATHEEFEETWSPAAGAEDFEPASVEEDPAPPDEGSADDDSDRIAPPDPERDVERFYDDEMAMEAVSTAAETEEEGFTFQRNLDYVDAETEDVYWTGLWGETYDADEFGPEEVEEFYRKHVDVLEQNSALHLGGWHFPEGHEKEGQFAIDLSVGIRDRERAKTHGEELNQESVANLAAGDFPDTKGDGNSPLDGPEAALDYKEEHIEEDQMRKLLRAAVGQALRARIGKDDRMPTYYVGEESGKRLSSNGIAHGARYGLDVEDGGEDGVLIIDGEVFRRVDDEE